MTVEEQNKEIVRRWNDVVVNERKLELIEEVLAEDYMNHGAKKNRDEVKQFFHELLIEQQSTFKATIEDIIAEGNKVAMRMTFYEEGQKPRLALSFYRLVNGKIVDDWYCSEPEEDS